MPLGSFQKLGKNVFVWALCILPSIPVFAGEVKDSQHKNIPEATSTLNNKKNREIEKLQSEVEILRNDKLPFSERENVFKRIIERMNSRFFRLRSASKQELKKHIRESTSKNKSYPFGYLIEERLATFKNNRSSELPLSLIELRQFLKQTEGFLPTKIRLHKHTFTINELLEIVQAQDGMERVSISLEVERKTKITFPKETVKITLWEALDAIAEASKSSWELKKKNDQNELGLIFTEKCNENNMLTLYHDGLAVRFGPINEKIVENKLDNEFLLVNYCVYLDPRFQDIKLGTYNPEYKDPDTASNMEWHRKGTQLPVSTFIEYNVNIAFGTIEFEVNDVPNQGNKERSIMIKMEKAGKYPFSREYEIEFGRELRKMILTYTKT